MVLASLEFELEEQQRTIARLETEKQLLNSVLTEQRREIAGLLQEKTTEVSGKVWYTRFLEFLTKLKGLERSRAINALISEAEKQLNTRPELFGSPRSEQQDYSIFEKSRQVLPEEVSRELRDYEFLLEEKRQEIISLNLENGRLKEKLEFFVEPNGRDVESLRKLMEKERELKSQLQECLSRKEYKTQFSNSLREFLGSLKGKVDRAVNLKEAKQALSVLFCEEFVTNLLNQSEMPNDSSLDLNNLSLLLKERDNLRLEAKLWREKCEEKLAKGDSSALTALELQIELRRKSAQLDSISEQRDYWRAQYVRCCDRFFNLHIEINKFKKE